MKVAREEKSEILSCKSTKICTGFVCLGGEVKMVEEQRDSRLALSLKHS